MPILYYNPITGLSVTGRGTSQAHEVKAPPQKKKKRRYFESARPSANQHQSREISCPGELLERSKKILQIAKKSRTFTFQTRHSHPGSILTHRKVHCHWQAGNHLVARSHADIMHSTTLESSASQIPILTRFSSYIHLRLQSHSVFELIPANYYVPPPLQINMEMKNIKEMV